MLRLTPRSTLFPYTTLFRSPVHDWGTANQTSSLVNRTPSGGRHIRHELCPHLLDARLDRTERAGECRACSNSRSEEHTSELQSLAYLVCRLLLEKKKKLQTQ